MTPDMVWQYVEAYVRACEQIARFDEQLSERKLTLAGYWVDIRQQLVKDQMKARRALRTRLGVVDSD